MPEPATGLSGRRGRTGTGAAVLVAVSLLLTGCAGQSPSALDAAGSGAKTVEGLTWLLFAVGAAVCVLITAGVLWAVWRRRRPDVQIRRGGRTAVVVAGVALPAVVLTVVYGIGLGDMRALQQPGTPAAVTVDVIGHIWWWEVRYPDEGVVTANEIHVPTGEVVHVRLTTADVNHSFWVPQLMPKTDLVAGRVNDTWIKAERDGTFPGRCAEYCGLQHAHMGFQVVAQPAADFERWVDEQEAPVQPSTDPLAQRGRQVFESASCASCHTVRGTTAHGDVGPDLTHVASRSTLGAGTIPNTKGYLAGWISNSQTIKPGNKMPPQPLSPQDLRALVAFLDGGSP
jgi:cytochrome c oxidase subunit 2